MDFRECVLVPTDLKKVQTILLRSCNKAYLISLALKHRLIDKSVVNKQQIYPTLIKAALQNLQRLIHFAVLLLLIMSGKSSVNRQSWCYRNF